MNTKTNTKLSHLIIIFTALAVALNIYGPKIPFPLRAIPVLSNSGKSPS